MPEPVRYGAIEAGGTKVLCGWADGQSDILQACRILTQPPIKVIPEMSQFLLSVSKSENKLPADHLAWDTVASDLAWAFVNMIVSVSSKKAIVCGDVFRVNCLFPKIRKKVLERLNGYVDRPEIFEHIDTYITPQKLGQNAGLKGALSLVL